MYFNHILTWLNQMGVSDFCAEEPCCFLKKQETVFFQTENQNPTASLLPWAEEQAQKASSLSEIYQILSSD